MFPSFTTSLNRPKQVPVHRPVYVPPAPVPVAVAVAAPVAPQEIIYQPFTGTLLTSVFKPLDVSHDNDSDNSVYQPFTGTLIKSVFNPFA